MNMVFVKPVKGVVVPDPDRKDELPAEGRSVVMSAYWQRRINEGSVVKTQPKKSTGGKSK